MILGCPHPELRWRRSPCRRQGRACRQSERIWCVASRRTPNETGHGSTLRCDPPRPDRRHRTRGGPYLAHRAPQLGLTWAVAGRTATGSMPSWVAWALRPTGSCGRCRRCDIHRCAGRAGPGRGQPRRSVCPLWRAGASRLRSCRRPSARPDRGDRLGPPDDRSARTDGDGQRCGDRALRRLRVVAVRPRRAARSVHRIPPLRLAGDRGRRRRSVQRPRRNERHHRCRVGRNVRLAGRDPAQRTGPPPRSSCARSGNATTSGRVRPAAATTHRHRRVVGAAVPLPVDQPAGAAPQRRAAAGRRRRGVRPRLPVPGGHRHRVDARTGRRPRRCTRGLGGDDVLARPL